MLVTHSGAVRHWFVPVALTAVAIIALLIVLRMAGVLSSQPLEETQTVFALKWGIIIGFFLNLAFVWRDHRKYTVTAASLANIPEPGSSKLPEHLRALDREHLIESVVLVRIRNRGWVMLGNVTAGLAMFAGLYVITRSVWCLIAIVVYAVFAAWTFRPRNPRIQ